MVKNELIRVVCSSIQVYISHPKTGRENCSSKIDYDKILQDILDCAVE